MTTAKATAVAQQPGSGWGNGPERRRHGLAKKSSSFATDALTDRPRSYARRCPVASRIHTRLLAHLHRRPGARRLPFCSSARPLRRPPDARPAPNQFVCWQRGKRHARRRGRRRCAAAPTYGGTPSLHQWQNSAAGRGAWHTPGRDGGDARARGHRRRACRGGPRAGPAAGGRLADASPHVRGRVRHERRRGAGPQRTPCTIRFPGGSGSRPRSRPGSNRGAYVAGARARIRSRHSGAAVSPFFLVAVARREQVSREPAGKGAVVVPEVSSDTQCKYSCGHKRWGSPGSLKSAMACTGVHVAPHRIHCINYTGLRMMPEHPMVIRSSRTVTSDNGT